MFIMKLIRSPIISMGINVALHLYSKEDFIAFFLFGIYKVRQKNLMIFKLK
jgi:hypothetical protein